MTNKTFKQIIIETSATVIPYLILFCLAFLLTKYGLKKDNVPSSPTTSGEVISGEAIIREIPRDQYIRDITSLKTIDDKITYILTNGKKGEDYTSFEQEKQNTNLGSTRDQNNIILTGYISRYLYPFPISNNKNGYLVITTSRPVALARDLLLGVNGKNLGVVLKGRELSIKNDNRYVFDMKKIPMADVSLHGSINLLNYAIGDKVNLSSVVGEKGNSVVQIALVFLPE